MMARSTVGAAIFTLGLAAAGSAGAQSPSATGSVVGPDSKPQPGVPIQVTGPEGKTTIFTDANGKWSLYELTPGTYQIQPLPGTATTSQPPISFTIDKSGLFSSRPNYNASVMKLDKDWK
jgi:Carboxypeptidase regulatory-like domain